MGDHSPSYSNTYYKNYSNKRRMFFPYSSSISMELNMNSMGGEGALLLFRVGGIELPDNFDPY